MAKKSIDEKKLEREQQENWAMQHILNVFLAGLVAECYLFLVNRGYKNGSVDSMLAWHAILGYGIWIGLALLAAGVGVAIWKRNDRRLFRIMAWTGGVGLFLCVSSYVIRSLFDSGVTVMCVLTAAAMGLGILYFLYQRECVIAMLALSGSFLAVWVCGHRDAGVWPARIVIGVLASVAVLAGAAVLTQRAQKRDGMLGNVRIATPGSDYRILYAAYVLGGAAILAALFFPAIAVGLEWALGVLVFAALAYYTTKLV